MQQSIFEALPKQLERLRI